MLGGSHIQLIRFCIFLIGLQPAVLPTLEYPRKTPTRFACTIADDPFKDVNVEFPVGPLQQSLLTASYLALR